MGINHNECSSSIHLWEGSNNDVLDHFCGNRIHLWEGRNNDVLDHFCGNTIVKVKNEGNMVGI